MTSPHLHVVTDERCLGYEAVGHPERPWRVSAVLARLQTQHELSLAWMAPQPVQEESILRAHSPSHVHHVLSTTDDFDPDTPWMPDIAEHAWRSVGGALAAMEIGLEGHVALSLMRPPGHHASRGRAMGFCYLSNLAIALLEAQARGVRRIAAFDFDVHHGNGTEAILLNRPGAASFSIHQYPCYPGTGYENVGENGFNYPVAPLTPRHEYRKALTQALEDVKTFQPDLVGVSAGFDAYVNDPIAQETLEPEDFHWLGRQVRALSVPSFSILEGGYSEDLPELVSAYLFGLCDR